MANDDRVLLLAQLRDFASDPANFPDFAGLLAEVLPDYVKLIWNEPVPYKAHFAAWQAAGVTILPNHYYSPIPDLNQLSAEALAAPLPLDGIDMRERAQVELLMKLKAFLPEYAQFLERGPESAKEGRFSFHGPFTRVDAELLYAMVRHLKPARLIEIGSGFSTLAIAEACTANRADGRPCNFLSIDPYPSYVLANEIDGLTEHRPTALENMPIADFLALEAGDVLFIDSSHVIKPGNDVEREYFHIIPRLRPGVVVHVHDIFMPRPYPPHWATHEHIFWNEQYLLAAFLMFNREFEVVLANSFLAQKYPEEVRAAVPNLPDGDVYGGSFWFRRIR